jgi:ubiquinone/menaquinone biosynthesis C-methylase UbiE
MVDHDARVIDSGAERPYLPAMGRRWLLPLYDPITRLAGLHRIHRGLIEQADLRAGLLVLEIGCGPGGLLRLVHRRFPDVDLAGLDPDPAALARARRKLGPAVRLDRGFADALPYPDASIDRVLSSYMWHHLDPSDRPRALREIVRVLRPGGQLHLVDIDAGDISGTGAIHGLLARRAHRRTHQAHDVDGRSDDLLALLRKAGLTDVTAAEQTSCRLGKHTFYRAAR